MSKPRYFLPFRRIGNKKAIIFLHGLLGEVGVWTPMAKLLLSDPALADWDIFSLGYRTTVLFQPFTEEPSLENQCELLYTNLVIPPIALYESLAFVAHSAGGLVLQRALVNFDDVLQRTTHTFFFGTPSTGS
jgi:pimeloyl-ACP methyl ester carboxylesterase